MKQRYRISLLVIWFCIASNAAFAAGHTVSISQANVLCFGSCNGSASATVSGGIGPFQYSWSPSGGSGSIATGLCAGPYTCTVTDQSDGSTASGTVFITQPPQITITWTNVTSATCSMNNGGACGITSGGTGPYTYWWSNNASTACQSNLASGSYTMMVTDANGCSTSASVVIPNTPGSNITSISANPATICAGQSSVLNPTVNGGTPPFTYTWTNPGNSLSSTTTSNPVASPTVTTTYTLTVIDANSCVSNNTVTLFVNQAVVATVSETDPTCNQANGSLTVNISQAAAPYTILWSNSQTVPTINNLTAGVYSVTVTDVNGCTAAVSTGLSNIGGPTVNTSTTNASCTNSNNGSATANVTGIPPFTYQWNSVPIQSTQTATALDAGNYLVSVTDSAGCISVAPAQVNALAGNLYMYVYSISPSNCSTSTGSATINASGGTLPYSYSWSNGDTTQILQGSLGGNYTATVNDANGCSVFGPVTIPAICGNTIMGRAYYDSNQNSIFDAGDFPISSVGIGVSQANYYTNTNSNGQYACTIWTPGTYTVYYSSPYFNYTCSSPAAQQVVFPGMGDTTVIDYIFNSPTQFQDLYLSLGSGVARPGFTQSYNILCQNRGTTVTSDTIWFSHDSILTVQYVSPPFDGYSHPTGYWLYNNFAPGQAINKYVVLQVPTIPNGGYIGRQMISNARIERTATDTSSWDNGDDEVDFITASYDPNLKESYSPTMDAYGDIWPADLTLDYTIHFQNSGNDTAFTVVVVDTLPSQLDVTTFRIGASSHPCTYIINGYNGINEVKFTFMNILLPDSNINEPASHGFVQFTIDRFPNLPIGTTIINEANNYFDFNPAVVTNADTVTITDPLNIQASEEHTFSLYPNPTDENVTIALNQTFAGQNAVVVLRDLSGREIMRTSSNGNNTIMINVQDFAAGVYTITVESAEFKPMTQKLIITEK